LNAPVSRITRREICARCAYEPVMAIFSRSHGRYRQGPSTAIHSCARICAPEWKSNSTIIACHMKSPTGWFPQQPACPTHRCPSPSDTNDHSWKQEPNVHVGAQLRALLQADTQSLAAAMEQATP